MSANSIVDEIRRAQVAFRLAGDIRSAVTLTPEEYDALRAECEPMAVYHRHIGHETIYGLTIKVDPSVAGTPLSERDK